MIEQWTPFLIRCQYIFDESFNSSWSTIKTQWNNLARINLHVYIKNEMYNVYIDTIYILY